MFGHVMGFSSLLLSVALLHAQGPTQQIADTAAASPLAPGAWATAASADKLYVCWAEGGGLWFRCSADGAETWVPALAMTPRLLDPTGANRPSIAVSGDRVVVAYESGFSGGNNVSIVESDDAGVTWAAPRVANVGSGSVGRTDIHCELTLFATHVAWRESGTTIKYNREDVVGGWLTSDAVISTQVAQEEFGFSVIDYVGGFGTYSLPAIFAWKQGGVQAYAMAATAPDVNISAPVFSTVVISSNGTHNDVDCDLAFKSGLQYFVTYARNSATSFASAAVAVCDRDPAVDTNWVKSSVSSQSVTAGVPVEPSMIVIPGDANQDPVCVVAVEQDSQIWVRRGVVVPGAGVNPGMVVFDPLVDISPIPTIAFNFATTPRLVGPQSNTSLQDVVFCVWRSSQGGANRVFTSRSVDGASTWLSPSEAVDVGGSVSNVTDNRDFWVSNNQGAVGAIGPLHYAVWAKSTTPWGLQGRVLAGSASKGVSAGEYSVTVSADSSSQPLAGGAGMLRYQVEVTPSNPYAGVWVFGNTPGPVSLSLVSIDCAGLNINAWISGPGTPLTIPIFYAGSPQFLTLPLSSTSLLGINSNVAALILDNTPMSGQCFLSVSNGIETWVF